jgi:transcriptional regulator with XRE-family HTH domain
MVQNKYVFDPYPLSVTMQRLAENLKARRLEKKLSTRSLSEMSGVPASSIQRFELKHSISLESYVKLAKALGYSEEILQLLSEPKYDTMEELLEINKNRKNSSSVVWLSMSMPKIWMTMHVISALSVARACGL